MDDSLWSMSDIGHRLCVKVESATRRHEGLVGAWNEGLIGAKASTVPQPLARQAGYGQRTHGRWRTSSK